MKKINCASLIALAGAGLSMTPSIASAHDLSIGAGASNVLATSSFSVDAGRQFLTANQQINFQKQQHNLVSDDSAATFNNGTSGFSI